MMIKREIIDRVGFFDEDFWSYYEETDLCNRIWLAGGECSYYPKAVVYHALGGTSSLFDNGFIQFHNFKNKLLSFLKNFEGWTLIKILPTYFILSLAVSFYWLLQGKGRLFLSFYRSVWWNIIHLPQTLKKRKVVQLLRKRKDKEIFKLVKKNPTRRYYYALIKKQNYEE